MRPFVLSALVLLLTSTACGEAPRPQTPRPDTTLPDPIARDAGTPLPEPVDAGPSPISSSLAAGSAWAAISSAETLAHSAIKFGTEAMVQAKELSGAEALVTAGTLSEDGGAWTYQAQPASHLVYLSEGRAPLTFDVARAAATYIGNAQSLLLEPHGIGFRIQQPGVLDLELASDRVRRSSILQDTVLSMRGSHPGWVQPQHTDFTESESFESIVGDGYVMVDRTVEQEVTSVGSLTSVAGTRWFGRRVDVDMTHAWRWYYESGEFEISAGQLRFDLTYSIDQSDASGHTRLLSAQGQLLRDGVRVGEVQITQDPLWHYVVLKVEDAEIELHRFGR
ncbi:MAG: hypothetical protein M3Y59_03430 [Myxococcota bacterium]|nr:hypothetical protein [Myxococcota bacterium]